MSKRHPFHYYHIRFWRDFLLTTVLVVSFLGWDYLTTPAYMRSSMYRKLNPPYGQDFHSVVFARNLQGSLIKGKSGGICMLDRDNDGIHDLKDEDLLVMDPKAIVITWEDYEYQRIEIRSEAGLNWNDKLATGYRYEVPSKAWHLFTPGLYFYRLTNGYEEDCAHIVGRFEIGEGR